MPESNVGHAEKVQRLHCDFHKTAGPVAAAIAKGQTKPTRSALDYGAVRNIRADMVSAMSARMLWDYFGS